MLVTLLDFYYYRYLDSNRKKKLIVFKFRFLAKTVIYFFILFFFCRTKKIWFDSKIVLYFTKTFISANIQMKYNYIIPWCIKYLVIETKTR